ncbi:MAG: arginase family protein [Paracoccaceae bacterium]|nr:arginase family protein [Paracoccaceae bacterium]
MSTKYEKSMMENLYWWGVPTLFRCPQQSLKAQDIALIGVPHSSGNGTTERDQHLGPRAVRNISSLQRRAHSKFKLDPWASIDIIDAGDVPFPKANDNEDCINQITKFYKRVDKKKISPVSIVGDHSKTGGILQALGNGALSNGQPISILHLDAHTDVFTKVPHFLGAKKSAAHWGAYLVDQGNVNPKSSMQIGLRGHPRTLDWLEPSYEYGYNVITMKEYNGRGSADVITEIKECLADNPIYITFDLDCLDPTIAPGVSNLEPGEDGFGMNQAVEILQSVRGLNVIGGDVVCLMPTKDSPNQITAMRAAAIMFEMICLIGENKIKSK